MCVGHQTFHFLELTGQYGHYSYNINQLHYKIFIPYTDTVLATDSRFVLTLFPSC